MGLANIFRCDQCLKTELVNKCQGIPDGWFGGKFLDQWSTGSSVGGATYKDKRQVFFCSPSCMGKFASQAFERLNNTNVDKIKLEVRR